VDAKGPKLIKDKTSHRCGSSMDPLLVVCTCKAPVLQSTMACHVGCHPPAIACM
jgi:hypothetical protein